MSKEPPERPLLRRDAIVDTAREMIRAGGLHGLSLRRLASQLGVTAPAL
jgi:AcrR family transcriptional regulator